MKTIVLALVLALAQAHAFAAPPTDESIERLMAVTGGRKMVDSMVQQITAMMTPAFEQAIGAEQLPTDQRQEARQFMASFGARMQAILEDELSWDKLQAMALPIYRESLTQEEVDGLIAFYNTPIGRSTVDKLPLVMQKSMLAMQQRIGPMQARIQAAAAETVQEFHKARATAPKPTL